MHGAVLSPGKDGQRATARSGSTGWFDRWAYVPESSRDLRFDFVRGACVLGMICNHIGGPSWARIFSLSNGILITPAEGFIFIAGFVFGMVYRRKAERQSLAAAIEQALGRAWTLYRLTVVLTLLFAVVLMLDGWPDGIGDVPSVPAFVADVLILHRTIYLVDVMLMWTILVGLAAGGLWLLARGYTAWLLGGSFVLWLAYQVAPDWASTVPWPIQGNEMFHIAAWQMPFLFAVTIGYHRAAFMGWYARYRWPALILAAAVFAMLVFLVLVPTPFVDAIEVLSEKQAEGPIRLLACCFVFQLAYLLATCLWRPLHAGLGWLFLPLGENALYAYTLHVILIALMWIPVASIVGSEAWSTALQLGTAACVWYAARHRLLFSLIPR